MHSFLNNQPARVVTLQVPAEDHWNRDKGGQSNVIVGCFKDAKEAKGLLISASTVLQIAPKKSSRET